MYFFQPHLTMKLSKHLQLHLWSHLLSAPLVQLLKNPKLFFSNNFKFTSETHSKSHHQKMRDAMDSCLSLKYCDERVYESVIALDYSHLAALPRQLNYVVKEMNPIVSRLTPAKI